MANSEWRKIASLVLALVFLPAASTAVADGITVVENKANYSYAQQVTFTLRVTSDAKITQIYLFFRATGDERAESVNVPTESARKISINHTHDLRRSPLPPFATITFWWQIEDAAGNTLATEPQQFEYTDNRFRWEQLSADSLTIHWIEGHGDLPFGQAPGFAGSRMAGLRKYEAGEVKEGVGAGGAMYAAGMLGVTQREMLGAVEAVYEELMGGVGGV